MFIKECRHKFEPRYDEENVDGSISISVQGYLDADGLRKLSVINKYIYDICTKCGKIINREKE